MPCQWCTKAAFVAIMPDGYKVCAECKPEVERYYVCKYCHTGINPETAGWARQRFERVHCHSDACKRADDIRYGRLCCDKAEAIPCVCAYSYKCEEHAPNGMHVGTHD